MKKKFVLPILLATSITLLTGCGVDEYKEKYVKAEVVHKEHDREEKKWNKKKKKIVTKKEEYEVVLKYKDIEKEFEFEDDSFYSNHNIGDSVKVVLVQGFDENGDMIWQDIELARNYQKGD